MSDDKSVFEAEAWTLFYWLGLGHSASPTGTSTEATVIVGGCPAPTPNGMIEVSRLNALVEEGLVEPTYLLQGPVYTMSEKVKALFNEIYNSFHREAQKTFLNKIALKYKGI